MKEITLTRNKTAIVSDTCYNYISNNKYYTTSEGYAARHKENCVIYMHREIYEKYIGMLIEGLEIDHINGNRLDNRIENLRLVNRTQNNVNSKKRKNGTSKYKGVYWAGDRNKWRACGSYAKGNPKHLGSFDNEIDAAKAYDSFMIENYGKNARLNFEGFNMSDEKVPVWCNACGKKFDEEMDFWKHYCNEIDDKTMGTKYEYTEDPDEWSDWISTFISPIDPYGE